MTYSKKRTLSYGVILISVLLAYFCRQVRTENVFMRNLADQFCEVFAETGVESKPIKEVSTIPSLERNNT